MNDLCTRPWRFKEATRRCVALLLAAVILAGCASPSGVAPHSENPHQMLERLARQYHVCGVAIAVVKHRILDTLDFASGCEPAVSVDVDSVFQAASLSKPVFAYAVLKLVQQGRLALDEPITRYLPLGYRHAFNPLEPEARTDEVTDARLHQITVRMALNHTAGLPNWASGPLTFDADPGTRWAYSGEGYVLLQRAVEAVIGEPLDRFMRTQVFKPLQMHHSDYVWSAQIAEHLLPGAKADGAPRTTQNLKTPVAAFSLYTTAQDYGRFVAAVLNDHELLARTMTDSVDVDPRLGLRWGLGWGLERTADELRLWQWGNNTGYRAFAMASGQTGDGLVVLTNSEAGLKLARPLTQAVLSGETRVFDSPMLGGGVMEFLCESIRLCL